MNDPTTRLATALLKMDSLRAGPDFFAGESKSVLVLDLLFNQMIGVERATAANLAIHDHFGRVFADAPDRVVDVTAWPYGGRTIRPPAKGIISKIRDYERTSLDGSLADARLSDLPAGIIGGIGSLERYLNRGNRFFDQLRDVELKSDQLRSLDPAKLFDTISPLTLYPALAPRQLASAIEIIRMAEGNVARTTDELRKELLALDRVGEETADTLLVYLFERPAVIVDSYLKRIAYRHYVLRDEKQSNARTRDLLAPYVKTRHDAHRIHARVDEIGVDKCFATNPDCESCPLKDLPRRD